MHLRDHASDEWVWLLPLSHREAQLPILQQFWVWDCSIQFLLFQPSLGNTPCPSLQKLVKAVCEGEGRWAFFLRGGWL